MTHRTRRGFDPTPTFADPLDFDDFRQSEHYRNSYANWCQDNARLEAEYEGTDQCAAAWDSWQRWMER